MDCTICSTPFASRGQPTCASCARSLIYQARLDHLTALLAKGSLHDQVNYVLTPPSQLASVSLPPGPEHVQITESARKHEHDSVISTTQATEQRCALIDEQLALLKNQMAGAKEENAQRKSAYELRRKEASAEKKELEGRMPQLLDPLKTSIKHLDRRLDKVHNRTLEGRAKLCQETARLAGLGLRKRKAADGHIFDECQIGGIGIVDLRQLNRKSPILAQ